MKLVAEVKLFDKDSYIIPNVAAINHAVIYISIEEIEDPCTIAYHNLRVEEVEYIKLTVEGK